MIPNSGPPKPGVDQPNCNQGVFFAGCVFRLTIVILLGGCAATKKGPVADNVISCRELSLRGMEAIERGQSEQAELLFSKAIESCPTDERARSRFAEALWRRGATSDAVAQMEQAVDLSGGDSGLLIRLGEMYYALGQFDRAGHSAVRALQRNRQAAAAWALQGDVLREKQQLDAALASYHRALSYQSHYPHVQLAAAKIYQQSQRPQRSLTTLEALADQFPPGSEPQEVLYLHGLTLKMLGRHEEAVESFVAASERGDPSADVLFQLSEAQWLAGDYASAHSSVVAALSLDPRHVAGRQLKLHIESQEPQLVVSLRP